MHLKNAGNLLDSSPRHIQHLIADLERSRVNPGVGQFSTLVHEDLESERRKWLLLAAEALFLVLRLRIDPGDRRDVLGRRQKIDDSIQQGLDAFVAQSRSAKDRDHLELQSESADDRNEVGSGNFFAFEIAFHEFFI